MKDSDRQESSQEIVQRSGDRTVQIGQVFGNVVFQRLQVISPLVAIIVIVSLVLTGAVSYYFYDRSQQPDPMMGKFNIAVAEFTHLDDDGENRTTNESQRISNSLSDFLESEFRETEDSLGVQVAHDKIGPISEDRAAEQLSEEINAHMVIYGWIANVGNDEIKITPRFYVSSLSDTSELTGTHELSFPIKTNATGDFDDAINELRNRSAVLVHFTRGLAHLSIGDIANASRSFEAAIHEAESYGTQAAEEQEVVYLFAAITSRLNGNFDKAHEYVDKALELNQEYSRALHVQGNIYLDQGTEAWNDSLIERALRAYEQAQDAQDKPFGALIDDRINISIGNIYVIRAQQSGDTQSPHFDTSIEYYQSVVDRYNPDEIEEGYQERLRSLAAIAYYGLGIAYENQGRSVQAIEAYEQSRILSQESSPDPQVDGLVARADERIEKLSGQN